MNRKDKIFSDLEHLRKCVDKILDDEEWNDIREKRRRRGKIKTPLRNGELA